MGRKRRRSPLGRVLDDGLYLILRGVVRFMGALRPRWVAPFADVIGTIFWWIDAQGRRVARQNLEAVYHGDLSTREMRDISRGGYRHAARAIALLLHLYPVTAHKLRRWVDVPPIEDHPAFSRALNRGSVLVSGHVGNWEILLALRRLYPTLPPTAYVLEEIPNPALNRLMKAVRGKDDIVTAMRKGGASLVVKTVRNGGIAAILADRNVRGYHGGIYANFLGLDARTTPLPSWIALRMEVPLHVALCIPTGGGRYRLWLSPDLTEHLPNGDIQSRQREVTERINHILSAAILAWPQIWSWNLARWKGRPTEEVGDYPAYSKHDPA